MQFIQPIQGKFLAKWAGRTEFLQLHRATVLCCGFGFLLLNVGKVVVQVVDQTVMS